MGTFMSDIMWNGVDSNFENMGWVFILGSTPLLRVVFCPVVYSLVVLLLLRVIIDNSVILKCN